MAAAWAVMNHLGDEGYLRLAETARRATLELAAAIDAHPELELRARARHDDRRLRRRRPRSGSTCSRSPTSCGGGAGTSIASSRPTSLHCTVNAVHDGLIPEFVAELHASIDTIVDAATAGTAGCVRHARVTVVERMQVDVQFNPAAAPWPLFRDATLAAEAAGFGAVWVLDHLAGVSMKGTGMLECFTCLGALATTTTTIGLRDARRQRLEP